MKKKLLLGVMLLGFPFLVADNNDPGTDEVLRQANLQAGGDKTAFKTVMNAAVRYPEAQNFVHLIRMVGLRNALANYGGKKKVKGKKNKALLSLIPQGQQLTLLIPINIALITITNKIKSAPDAAARKAAIAQALTLVQAHIIKGTVMQAALKGQVETLGGSKIDADNLQFYKTDVVAGNGVIHLIKALAWQPVASQPVVQSAPTAQASQAASIPAPAVVPVTATVPADQAAVSDQAVAPTSDTSQDDNSGN